MSRSNPNEKTPNPATRWFEWKSSEKSFQFYDKEKKEVVPVKLPFTFIVLDRTATIKGYNSKLKLGIYSNEVRDTREQPLAVKYHGAETIAEGMWSEIKDKVGSKSVGGKFALNIYLAFRAGKQLFIGCFQATGCALGAWFEFEKANRRTIFEKAVTVKTTRHDSSGDVEYDAPVFTLADVTEETNEQAKELDKDLQAYFAGYFKLPVVERAHPGDGESGEEAAPQYKVERQKVSDEATADDTVVYEDDVPF